MSFGSLPDTKADFISMLYRLNSKALKNFLINEVIFKNINFYKTVVSIPLYVK